MMPITGTAWLPGPSPAGVESSFFGVPLFGGVGSGIGGKCCGIEPKSVTAVKRYYLRPGIAQRALAAFPVGREMYRNGFRSIQRRSRFNSTSEI